MAHGAHSCWDLAVALAAHHHAGDDPIDAGPGVDEIYQVSTMRLLVAGVFDGETRYADVIRHGDFGVGTFNALDGEMAAVDGCFYHLYSDGSVAEVAPDDLTPFAAVTWFRADAEIDVEVPHDRAELLRLVDETVPSTNLFYAIRIDGRFDTVTTRTAARQSKPYPRLVTTTATQVEHSFSGVSGTMVGFRAPQYAQGATVAGYHLHFVDDSRTVGGHVLDFQLNSGTVWLDLDADLHVEMPTGEELVDRQMDAGDLAAEIEQSESASHPTSGT